MTLRADHRIGDSPSPTTDTDIADERWPLLGRYGGIAITLADGRTEAHDTTEVPPNTHPSVPDTDGGRYTCT